MNFVSVVHSTKDKGQRTIRMNLSDARTVVLGAAGMLGQMVCRYFEPRVRELVRFRQRFGSEPPGAAARKLAALEPDVVINCVGRIKQKSQDPGELHYANAVLPLEWKALLPAGTVLVHPSTDCVFSGKAVRPYKVTDPADAEDVYGWSKHLGETALMDRPNTLILRVSIIGPDDRPEGPGLLNWFLRQPDGAKLKGFTNHWWNGITTWEWCRQVEALLEEGNFQGSGRGRLMQLGTADAISKDGLLRLFAEMFGKPVRIEAHETPQPVYRVLEPEVVCKPIREQLGELRMG